MLVSESSGGGKTERVSKEVLSLVRPPPAVLDRTEPPSSTSSRSYGSTPLQPMWSPKREENMSTIMNELAMRAGAVTTIPEVEAETTGVPAWDAAIAAARNPMPSLSSTEPGYGAGARAGTTIREAPMLKILAEEKQAVEEQASRTQRAAMGKGPDGFKVLGAKGYKNLELDQKAAVDFNTLLSKATSKDEKLRTNFDLELEAEDANGVTYGENINEIFGTQIGPAIFAPNTVNMLNTMGFKTDKVSMDDFLDLKIGLTQADLSGFSLEQPVNTDADQVTPGSMRAGLQQELVAAFKNTRTDQAAGTNLLGLQRALLGTESELGFGTPDSRGSAPMEQQLNDYFQRNLSALAQPMYAKDKDILLQDIRINLDDVEWDSFINFLDVSSRDAMQYRRPLVEGVNSTSGEPLQFMLPRDFRKHMGF